MFEESKRLKKKVERLTKENKELRNKILEYESANRFFDERVQIINEKEYRYNLLIDELEVLKKHYIKVIKDTKKIRSAITKEIERFK